MEISMLYISPLFPFILIGIDFFEYKFRHRRASESSSILFFSFLSRVRISWFFCVCVMEARRTNTLWRPTLSDTHQTFFNSPFGSLLGRCLMCVCDESSSSSSVCLFYYIHFTPSDVGTRPSSPFSPYRHHTLYRVSWRTDEPKEP